jgi:hypothetical protein
VGYFITHQNQGGMKSVFIFTAPDGRNRAIGAFDTVESANRWGEAHGFKVVCEHRIDQTPIVYAETAETYRLQYELIRKSNEAFYAALDKQDEAEAAALAELQKQDAARAMRVATLLDELAKRWKL